MIEHRIALTFMNVSILSTLAMGADPAKDAGILLKEGKYQEETIRDLDAAIEVFKKVRELAAPDLRSLASSDLAVARCLFKKGIYSEARQRLNLIVDEYPGFPALIQDAQQLLQRMPESDPAVFMPPDTLIYGELVNPWSQMERLAKLLDEAGVVDLLQTQWSDPSLALFHAVLRSISMKRLPEIKKIEAFGVGLIDLDIDPEKQTRSPEYRFLLVLYPGQSDWYKSIIAFVKGTRDKVGQHFDFQIYNLPTRKGEMHLGLGKETILLASDSKTLADAIHTAHDTDKLSLADNAEFRRHSAARRQDSAVIAYANLSKLLPILRKTQNRENLEMLSAVLDLETVSNLMARVDLDDHQIAIELTALLQEGQANKFYKVWKSGAFDPKVLSYIPQNAIGAVSMTLRERDRTWEESFDLFEALYGAKWQESAGVDFIGIVNGVRMLLGSERGKQILGNIHSLTCVFTANDLTVDDTNTLFDDLVLLVHVKDEDLLKDALKALAGDYLLRHRSIKPSESSLTVQGERVYCLADSGPVRFVVQKGDWAFASNSKESIEKCLDAIESGRCIADLPSDNPLRQIPLNVHKLGFLQMDRTLKRLVKNDEEMRSIPSVQRLPVVFTTVEKSHEIVVRFEFKELPALVGQIAKALVQLPQKSESNLPQRVDLSPETASLQK